MTTKVRTTTVLESERDWITPNKWYTLCEEGDDYAIVDEEGDRLFIEPYEECYRLPEGVSWEVKEFPEVEATYQYTYHTFWHYGSLDGNGYADRVYSLAYPLDTSESITLVKEFLKENNPEMETVVLANWILLSKEEVIQEED